MDFEAMIKSLVPVSELISPEEIEARIANETLLQKAFDNRKGPSVDGSPCIDYHVFTPRNKTAGKKYPVLFWLHGMSQGQCFREPLRGTDVQNFASEAFQAKFGDGAYIVVPRANEDLGMGSKVGFLFTNSWINGFDEIGRSKQRPELVAAIEQFLAEEKDSVDTSRLYLSGFSAGGYMTWQTMLAMPDTFAAVAPICHARLVPTDAQIASIAHIPLWLICGEKDFLYEGDVAPTIEKLKAAHPPALLRTSIFENVYNPDRTPAESEHHSWVPVTYDMFYADGTPYDMAYPLGFIDWLMSHKK